MKPIDFVFYCFLALWIMLLVTELRKPNPPPMLAIEWRKTSCWFPTKGDRRGIVKEMYTGLFGCPYEWKWTTTGSPLVISTGEEWRLGGLEEKSEDTEEDKAAFEEMMKQWVRSAGDVMDM